MTDRRRVIFGYESCYSLSTDDHRTFVWRYQGQRSYPAFVVERRTGFTQSITVREGIDWNTRSPLIVLKATKAAPVTWTAQ